MIAAIVLSAGAALVAIASVGLAGRRRWLREDRELHERLLMGRSRESPDHYDVRELEGLPAPVARYFRAVLPDGQRIIREVALEHTGEFNLSEAGERWVSFRSRQRVVTDRPGFVWSARMPLAPGLPVLVHDAYVRGRGILRARLLGLWTVAEQEESRELALGELMRFMAEATWYPTALLPGQGVRWEGVDASTARATLSDGELEVTLDFAFGDEGLVHTVRSEARYREEGGKLVPLPWEGRFWDYERRDGVRVPIRGEVAWIRPDGPAPYWRGTLRAIEFDASP